LYCIRGFVVDETSNGIYGDDVTNLNPSTLESANSSVNNSLLPLLSYTDQSFVTAAAAAAVAALDQSKLSKKSRSELNQSPTSLMTNGGNNVDNERRLTIKRESQEKKDQKTREREALLVRKATERAVRESSREERRRRKLEQRELRERYAQEQKEAALKRAAELVLSNRVPLEITRGVAAAKMVAASNLMYQGSMGGTLALTTPAATSASEDCDRCKRSAIVVSTAGDLHQIVTHSMNLFAKYSAIAREHNQKVTWSTVSKELGIHVKVREKYARMFARAEKHGFDWIRNAQWKIKDHPEVRCTNWFLIWRRLSSTRIDRSLILLYRNS
jgi:hypothetical protein